MLIYRQKPRDPRFMHAAGRYDPSKFKQQYDFLSGLHSNELLTLREHMKRAQKLLANSPAHLRAEREEEVNRLEHAVKRAESAVNLDNRERVESTALQSAKQTEKEKRKHGKTGWWMKQCKSSRQPQPPPPFTSSLFVFNVYSRKENTPSQSPSGCHRIGWRKAGSEEGGREEAKEDKPKGEKNASVSPERRNGMVRW